MAATEITLDQDVALRWRWQASDRPTRFNALSATEWLRRYYPQNFTREFTRWQLEFWKWGDSIKADSVGVRPRVQCEPRGLGKSTGAETLVVRLLARKARKYALYISATDDQAVKHLMAIKRRLESPALLRDYPHLQPRLESIRGTIQNWSRERLVTADGAVVEAVSLLGHMRGFKSEDNVRPDLMVLDDIDADPASESQDVVQKKIEILRSEILLAGAENTVVLFAQNLIHRDSVCAQVLDHRADILSEREFSGPHSLMKWYDAEKIELPDGARRWRIIAGEVADPAITTELCDKQLNLSGKESFDRECQQDVDKVAADKDFREWSELFHVCTVSEVLAGFKRAGITHELRIKDGRLMIPSRWEVGTGLDWGTTRGHPAVYCPVARPDERFPFSDIYFVLGEVVMPEYPYDRHVEPQPVSPGRVARAIRDWQEDHGIADSQIVASLMSHEASAARNTFIVDLPDDDKVFFSKWQAMKGSGVPQIQNLLEIDSTKPHPFRVYPAGHPDAGMPVAGRPRLIVVVADDQGGMYMDSESKLRVRGPKDADGCARARFEIPLYNHRNTGLKKINDDFVDAFRGIMAKFAVHVGPLTYAEKVTAAIPEPYRYEEMLKGGPITPEQEMAHVFQRMRAVKSIKPRQRQYDEFGRLIN